METQDMAPTPCVEPPWMAPPRRALPWFRLGLAGALVAFCAWQGLGVDCRGVLPDVRTIATLLALVGLQGIAAIGSFGTCLLACVRRDWRRALGEAIVGVLMLLAVPVGVLAMASTTSCGECRDDGC
jgi:hypothetical protein